MRWFWLAATILLAVAAFAVWRAFTSPAFVAGLIATAAGVAVKALLPVFKPRDLSEAERETIRQGGDVGRKAHGHGGENK